MASRGVKPPSGAAPVVDATETAKRLNAIERALRGGATPSEVERSAAAKWALDEQTARQLVASVVAATAVASHAPTAPPLAGASDFDRQLAELLALCGYSASPLLIISFIIKPHHKMRSLANYHGFLRPNDSLHFFHLLVCMRGCH